MNGEIIDYYNVFKNMKKALKDYAEGQEGQEAVPVMDKKELFKLLDGSIAEANAFCREKGIELRSVIESDDVFKNVGKFKDFADKL